MVRLQRQSREYAARAHRETLLETLERRIQVARAKGDNELLRQLEAEAEYLK